MAFLGKFPKVTFALFAGSLSSSRMTHKNPKRRRPQRTQRRTGTGQVPLVVEVRIDPEARPGNLVGALAALLVERARKAVEARSREGEKRQ